MAARAWHRAAAYMCVGLVMAGCGTAVQAADAAAPTPPAERPSDLLGIWRVTGAPEALGAFVRMANGVVTIEAKCGWISGGWRASTAGAFLAQINRGRHACFPKGIVTPTWLADAVAFRTQGQQRDMLDDEGKVLATLFPWRNTGASSGPTMEPPPPLSAADRAALDTSPPVLPSDLTYAERDALIGQWVPIPSAGQGDNLDGYVMFKDNGDWTASSGCNTEGSRWQYTDAQLLALNRGVVGEVACISADNPVRVPVPSWVMQAVRAAFDGDQLVLVDRDGRELGRLRREPTHS